MLRRFRRSRTGSTSEHEGDLQAHAVPRGVGDDDKRDTYKGRPPRGEGGGGRIHSTLPTSVVRFYGSKRRCRRLWSVVLVC